MTSINGTEGADHLDTGVGPSVVHGLGGDDTIVDSWFFAPGYVDELHGDDGNDHIYAGAGDDLLFGEAGDDELSGGAGADTLDGGDGNDYLTDTSSGGDTLRGGAGDDVLYVNHPNNAFTPVTGTLTTLDGGAGNDRITLNLAATPQTLVIGGAGDDYVVLTRTKAAVTISLGSGADTIELSRDFGGWPFTGVHVTDFDTGPGGDRLTGLSEFLYYAIGHWDGLTNPFATNQLRLRQSGADTIFEVNFQGIGNSFVPVLIFENTNAASFTTAMLDGFDPSGAAAPPQSIDGGAIGETIHGGQGDDVIHGNDGDDSLYGNAGADALYGGDGNDRLEGGVGPDLLDGGAGDDDFYVTASGADTVIGGDGDDYLYYRRNDNYATFPAGGVPASHVDMGAGNDIVEIQNFGQQGGVTILYVDLGAGDDTIHSSSGTPYQLTLGAGADTIYMNAASGAVTVTDFNSAEDHFASLSSMLHSNSLWTSGDPYAGGQIRLVQQGADTIVQTTIFTTPYTGTRLVLLGVDARTLTAANFGGFAPDGIWSFGTSASDVLTGGAGKDRLSDDKSGADTLDGAGGNDIISWSRAAGAAAATSHLLGGAGDDRINISGGAGSTLYVDAGDDRDDVHLAGVSGTAILTLGAGQDTLTFDGIAAAANIAVTDFQTGAAGDALSLTPFLTGWLTGWNPADNPFATGHVRLVQSGDSTLLQFDRNGGGDAWATIVTFQSSDAAAFTAFNLGGWDSGTFGNEAPAFSANDAAVAQYIENGAAFALAPLATLADVDSANFAGGTLTVSLAGAGAGDLIAVRSEGPIAVSGAAVSYQGTVIGTLSGGSGAASLIVSLNADASAAAAEALVRNLTYASSSDALATGPRPFTIVLADGDGGAAQILANVQAYAVNDAPTIANLDGDIVQYVEGAAATRLDAGAVALVADFDSLNFTGGTLRVAITAGGNAVQDILGVQLGAGIGITGSPLGNAVTVDGFYLATISGGRDGADLVFNFDPIFFLPAAPAAVSRLLQALTYYNFDAVAPTDGIRTITLSLSDGDGTDLGGHDTRTATLQVDVTAVNEAPQISTPPDPIVYYNEDSPFAPLMAGVYLSDAEYRAGYGGGSLTLTVSGGEGAIDLASWSTFHAVANGGGFDLVYTSYNNDPPVTVGHVAGLGTSAVTVDALTSASANIFSYLLSAFVYSDPSNAPSTAPRTVTLTFDDGGNGNGVGALSATRTQTLQMVAANDAPILGNVPGGNVDYTVDRAAVPLFASATVTDPDQPDSFAGGSLQLWTSGAGARIVLIGTRFAAQDVGGTVQLTDTVSHQQIGTMSSAPGGITVALTAGATPEAVNALAQSFGFETFGDDPTLGSRGVSMILYDGGHSGTGGSLTSNSLLEIVNVAPDAAAIAMPDALATDEATALTGSVFADHGAGADADPDGPALVVAEVNGSAANVGHAIQLASGALLTLNADGSYFYNPNGAFAALAAPGSGASSSATTDTFSYTLASGNTATVTVTVAGLDSNDTLRGTAGPDTLIGGTGNDFYFVEDAGDRVLESAGQGTDAVYASVSYRLAAGSEVETLSTLDPNGTAALNLTGNNLVNTLIGNAGVNQLNGGGGADTLIGLGGDDVYFIDFAGARVAEAANGGFDSIYSGVSYVLGANVAVELLSTNSHAATVALNLTGNNLVNTLVGNAGVNLLNGGGGADTLIGLGGDDVYFVDFAGVRVAEDASGGFDSIYSSVSYVLGAGVAVELLSTNSHAATVALNLTGNNFVNTLVGNAGANLLNGGGGADTLIGLGGDDTYLIDFAGVRVAEDANGGFDSIYSSVNYVLGTDVAVELLSTNSHAATVALNLTGNNLVNTLVGNAGVNLLNGGGGADTLIGLGGDDTYLIDFAGVRIAEAANGGFDSIYSSVSYVLGTDVAVELLSTNSHAATVALNLTGNNLANTLVGNAGANLLNGGGGADTLIGLGGDDVYQIDFAGVQIAEGANGGFDSIYTSVNYVLNAGVAVELLSTNSHAATAALNLTGNDLANTLVGNAGANALNGGGGADTLIGLGGADTFAFTTAPGSGNFDVIADFSAADDTIALDHNAFAGLGLGALSANAFVAGTSAHDADDRIIYDSATGALYFDPDGIGGAAQVQFATLISNPGLAGLAANDFMVI